MDIYKGTLPFTNLDDWLSRLFTAHCNRFPHTTRIFTLPTVTYKEKVTHPVNSYNKRIRWYVPLLHRTQIERVE